MRALTRVVARFVDVDGAMRIARAIEDASASRVNARAMNGSRLLGSSSASPRASSEDGKALEHETSESDGGENKARDGDGDGQGRRRIRLEDVRARRARGGGREASVAGNEETTPRRTVQVLTRSPKEESNIYVKNMPIGVTVQSLRQTFEKFGPVISSVALNTEGPYPGGLVRFVRAEDAQKAIQASMDGELEVEGSVGRIVVRLAEKRGASAQTEEVDAVIEEPARRRKPVGDLSVLVGESIGEVDSAAASASREKREAALAARRQQRAEQFAGEKAKAQALVAERRAERIAQGIENLKSFVPRYKRGEGAGSLTFDPNMRVDTSSRRTKDSEMALGISQRKRVARAPGGARQGGRVKSDSDLKLQQALSDRIRQARALQEANKQYDYNRQEFDRQSTLLFSEALDVRHILRKPRLGSSQPEKSDEERIDEQKDFLMKMAGLSTDQEFEFLKKEAIDAYSQQREFERLKRERLGLSPFRDNFLAERASLGEFIADIPKDNVLYDFAQLAWNTLDSNPHWSYASKKKALSLLQKESRYHAE